jgi:lipopolysaccharide/colanic/teichoic acid biosynthesis glycosyltransferase
VHRFILLSIDLLFVASATILAVMLRGNFESVTGSVIVLTPYIFTSVGCALVIFFVAGLDRTPWRYSSVADHFQVVILTVFSVLLALVLTFALNRLTPVARSLPVVQGALIISVLICARSTARLWHARQINIHGHNRITERHETVLLVGANTVAELFLVSAKEFASRRVEVAGIIAEEPSLRGRVIQQTPVLGVMKELQEILQSLEVHGVTIERIVVAIAAYRLQPHSLEILLELEKSSNIVVQFLSERLGFEDNPEGASLPSDQMLNSVPRQRVVPRFRGVVELDHANSTAKFFRLGKRIVDIIGAAFLLVTTAPLVALVAFIAALDVGFPVIFWQQRPGLHGRPFKLYKFRTMRAPHDKYRTRIPDEQRLSAVGKILRRTRLDELPQFYNVLIGDMSLVGPRPLLPCDQAAEYAARLSMRPGITGWAQVNGGRIISTSDKLTLDIWYVQNASWILDVAILFRTVRMVLFGDRINFRAVNQARNRLVLNSMLRTTITPAE